MSRGWHRSVLAGVLVGAALSSQAIAARAQIPDAVVVKRHIEEVLAQPAFSTKRADYEYRFRGERRPKKSPDTESPASGRLDSNTLSRLDLAVTIIARFTEALLWSLVVAAIVLLIVYRERWMRRLPFGAATVRTTDTASVVVGLDVRPASLPDDVADSAWRLWRGGDGRGCVSLLYRGALAMLIARFGLELPASATESDCVARIQALCDHWRRYFGTRH